MGRVALFGVAASKDHQPGLPSEPVSSNGSPPCGRDGPVVGASPLLHGKDHEPVDILELRFPFHTQLCPGKGNLGHDRC